MDLELRRLMGSSFRMVAIEEDQGGSGGAPPPAAAAPPPDTLTKAQAEAMAAQARKDAEKALLAQFGEGMTPAKVKERLDAQKAAEDARKDEITRATEAAAERERRAEERERAAAAKERAANVRAALLAAGVKTDRLAKAERIVDVADDADEAAITAAVEAVKNDTPEWFPAPGQPPAPSSLPVGTPPSQHTNPDDLAEARARGSKWRERNNGTPKNPFEGFRKIG